MDSKVLEKMFTYHAPKNDQPKRYEQIRQGAKLFADVINECAPDSADKTAAIRKLRECVMTANVAIALEEDTAKGLYQG